MTGPFSLLVIGDTQYLFDGDRRRPDLLAETFRHVRDLLDAEAIAPLQHVIHVGDVTEHGWQPEVAEAHAVLAAGRDLLGGLGLTIATGNHDVAHHSDDSRGTTAFVAAFGSGCELLTGRHAPAVEHGPGGYSSWRVVATPGGELGVLALDWRPSPAGWDWAAAKLAAHPDLPTVVVSHEIACDSALTEHGRKVQALLAAHPQAFLVLGGHHWPATRVTTPEREYHAINYQELPFGGAGAARIYEFDPARGSCQVISVCPSAHLPEVFASVAARRSLALSRPADQFAFPLPPSLGGRDDPWQAAGLELVLDLAPAGSDELELPLPGHFVLEVQATLPPAMQAEWQVLLCRLGQAPGGSPEPLAALSLSSENFVGWLAFTTDGETSVTSHEYQPGANVTILVANGPQAGVWVDGDPVGRVDANLGGILVPGPWRWRVGSGEYENRPADPFRGRVTRVRAWAGSAHHS